MKRIRGLILVSVLVTCFSFGVVRATATDDLLGKVVDGSVLTDDKEAVSIVYPWARGTYLSSGSGSIAAISANQVQIAGSTVAYQNVDEIKVTLHLQKTKTEGSGWLHVSTLGPKTAKNTNYVSNSSTYSVTRGYYYRVHGAHTIIEDSKVESLTSNTNAVKVP